MNRPTKWLGAAFSLAVIISMALLSFGTGTSTASAQRTVQKSGHNAPSAAKDIRCKTRTKATGTIIYSDIQFPDTLNPDQTTAAVSVETIDSMFDGPVAFNQKAKLFADMLTRVPTVANGDITNGGKTYTFHIKPGIVWSDGSPIVAKDWKFGFAIDNDKLSGPYCDAGCNVISRIDTPNSYTVVFHLSHVDAAFLDGGHYPEVWPTKWPKDGSAWNNDAHAAANKIWADPTFNFQDPSYPTSGAYQVTSFVANNRITLKPNPRYNILNCGGQIKNLIFSFYSDTEGMIAAAASHQTNVTQDYALVNSKELLSHKQFKTVFTPAFFIEHVEFNHDKTYNGAVNPVANAKVRVALGLAMNKVKVLESAQTINAATAKSVEAYGFLVNTKTFKQPFANPKVNGQWDPLTKKYVEAGTSAALKDARKLLAQAGYSNGFTLDFQTTTAAVRSAEMSAICASWSLVKVICHQMTTPAGTLFGQWDKNGTLDHGLFQAALFAFIGSPEPDGLKGNLSCKFIDRRAANHSAINGNYSGTCDPKIDADFKAGAASVDPKVRSKSYGDADARVNQNADWVLLYYRPSIAATDGKVTPFADNPTATGAEWNTFAWKVSHA